MKRFVIPVVLLGLVACHKSSTNEIRIGEYNSLTGGTATFGQDSHDGIALAIEEANAAGGVLGKKIVLITEDDQSRPEEAKAAVLKLIQREKVVALLGEAASGRSLAAAPEAQRYKVPMIAPSATNPKVTQIGDFIFRACYIDPFQGEQVARFAVESLKLKKFAILKDVKNDYSVGLAKVFEDAVKKMGGEIVDVASYSEGDVEFRSQLTAIKATHPEAIFIPGYYTEVGLIARQARELGIDVPLLGTDGWDSPKTVEIGGKAVNNSYFSASFMADDPDPSVQTFIKKFKAKYGHVPSGIAVSGYDAAQLLLNAMTRAGSTDSQKIRDALATTKNFETVTGSISVGPDRNLRKRLVIVKIDEEQPKFYTAVNP
ncbi:MAG: ethanolamine utilization protein EutJ [Deltaproteobacteria bacterium CG11_big_fil_rev_8_21_14_0_20_47_16]|nr:MAG: ethanolamine utilization protein EutJ [Deltaproteobacteria bacterium CG11_big_fil_rev_8_21_14_0_20_47_16]